MLDLNDKVTGSTLTAAEWNNVPSEIQNVIEGLGITLSGGDLNQLGKAIAGYVANGTFYADSGAANAYVLSTVGSKQSPTAYTDGLEAEFIVGNTNTGSSTVNVAGLGVKNIASSSSAGALTAGDIVRLRYNITNGDFDIVGGIATQAETNAGTVDNRFVTPLKMRFGFSSLFATNGYIIFPSWLGGVVIQWGLFVAATSETTHNYPIAFPSQDFQVYATDAGTSTIDQISVQKISTSQFKSKAAAGTPGFAFLAVGT